MSRTRKPLLVIGLDAAEPSLVETWAAAGELPALAGIMARGQYRRLASPAWMSTGPVWPCFYAGTSPASHGRFFFRQLEGGTYRIVKKRADDINAVPFWMELTKQGARVAVVDVPKTFPIPDAATVQLVGWGVHSAAWPASSWPGDLLGQVATTVGQHPVPNCDEVNLQSVDDYRRFTEDLVEGIARKQALATRLLDDGPWDMFLVVFSEAHCSGHRLWHLHDESHPDHSPGMRQVLGDPLLQVYRRLDAAIGALIDAAGDVSVVVFSPHGMGPNYGASHLLPQVLQRLGLDGSDPDRRSTVRLRLARRAGTLRNRLIERVPDWFVRAIRRSMPATAWDALTTRLLSVGNAWSRSSAFCVPGDFAGAIRINLQGREPAGTVKPGAEFEAMCDSVTSEMMALRELDSGVPAVREVVRVADVYSGTHLDQLPDLIVRWNDERPFAGLVSPAIGEIRGTLSEPRSGEDRSDGFLAIADCPDLETRPLSPSADLMDLAPTITELLGLRTAGPFDGRSLIADRPGSTPEESGRQ